MRHFFRPRSSRKKSGSNVHTTSENRSFEVESLGSSLTSVSQGTETSHGEAASTKASQRSNSARSKQQLHKADQDTIRGPLGLRQIHSSPEPLVDLIFVHGLRGGSIKTWRKGLDQSCFWPQNWLPNEPGFVHVNIHTYGYDSDWANPKSAVLDVHDFGQRLAEEMRNCPELRTTTNKQRPIILIGHSMGGLVIKKAFVISQETPELHDRIRCLMFLATPHRGSDYAAILNGILKSTGILDSKEYINDLVTDTRRMQLINEEFVRFAHDIPIFSFYEALKTSIGPGSAFIVDKTSAILGPGFSNERVQYLDANHRDICKFATPNDPNYVSVRNALLSAIDTVLKNVSTSQQTPTREQRKLLRSYLKITERPDEQELKLEGSCQWINEREDFQNWKSGVNQTRISIFWVHANPGTGKSVLASHVLSCLEDMDLNCASHFFHVGDAPSTSLSLCLRSIVYQMATSNVIFLKEILDLIDEETTLDLDSSRSLWNRLFKRCILETTVETPHYWVIDALDECDKYQELFSMLKGAKPNFPLRIFFTSRNVHDMQRLQRLLHPSASVDCIEIPSEASLDDIKLYIQSREDDLPVDVTEQKEEISRQLLQKSNACFLWVRLVMDQLVSLYFSESMTETIEKIPQGMMPLYKRIAGTMAQMSEKHITKAILTWTVASSRTLKLAELSHALRIDSKTASSSLNGAIGGLCGQLVTIHKGSDYVELIHLTAREFLLSSEAGEFMISLEAAHEHLALTCLKLLSSNELQPPRNPHSASSRLRPPASPLMDYAVNQFTEHLISASTNSNQLVLDLEKFLKTNVLSWVEILAERGNLDGLFRASQNLRSYADRLWRDQSSLVSHVKVIDDWATDLSRLVTHFGKALLHYPASIHFLLPPVCPPDTGIFRQFGNRPGALSVVGHRQRKWTDWIATIKDGEKTLNQVSCGPNSIAARWDDYNITFYNNRTYQKELAVRFPRMVGRIHLIDQAIAIYLWDVIVLFDLHGSMIWEAPVPHTSDNWLFLLTSTEDYIVAVMNGGPVRMWDKASGALSYDETLLHRSPPADAMRTHAAALCPNNELMALAMNRMDQRDYHPGTKALGALCLWNIHPPRLLWALEDRELHPESDLSLGYLFFNPSPATNALIFILDYYFYLYDIPSARLIKKVKGTDRCLSAAYSPSGQTFLTTTQSGEHVYVWDSMTLSLLFCIPIPYRGLFKTMDFMFDGFSVVCSAHASLLILAPAGFSQRTVVGAEPHDDVDNTKNASNANVDNTNNASNANNIRHIQRYACATCSGFCGFACLIRREKEERYLRIHPSLPFVYTFSAERIVSAGLPTVAASAVAASAVAASAVPAAPTGSIHTLAISKGSRRLIAANNHVEGITVYELTSSTLDTHLTPISPGVSAYHDIVRQMLFDSSGCYLLVSCDDGDHVYQVKDTSLLLVGSLKKEEKEVRDPDFSMKSGPWFVLPPKDETHGPDFALYTSEAERPLGVDGLHRALVRCYDAKSFSKPYASARASSFYVQYHLSLDKGRVGASQHVMELYGHIEVEPSTNSLILERFYYELRNPEGKRSFVVVYDLNELNADAALDSSEHQSLKPINSIPPHMCREFLGIKMGDNGIPRLYFIDNDSWLSSMLIRTVDSNIPLHTYTQHMYIPEYLLEKSCGFENKGSVGRPTPNDVVFFSDDELLVFEGALRFGREVPLGQSYAKFMELQQVEESSDSDEESSGSDEESSGSDEESSNSDEESSDSDKEASNPDEESSDSDKEASNSDEEASDSESDS